MAARDDLLEYAEEYSWNDDTMLRLACEYIDQQENEDYTFADFLDEKANDEDLGYDDRPDDDYDPSGLRDEPDLDKDK